MESVVEKKWEEEASGVTRETPIVPIGEIFEFDVRPVRQVFFDTDSFWGVCIVTTPDKNIPCTKYNDISKTYDATVVGKMPEPDTSKKYHVIGRLVLNERYKQYQYQLISFTEILEGDRKRKIEDSYLKAVLSQKQYETLSNAYPNIAELLSENPDFVPDFSKTKGIKEKSWMSIKGKILNNMTDSEIVGMLLPLGVSKNAIKKLLKEESNPTILKKKLLTNPYQFTKINGFGFLKVDRLALKINSNLRTSSFRVAAYTQHILEEQAINGRLWISIRDFGREFTKLIPQNSPEFKACFKHVEGLIQVERELTKTGDNTMLFVEDSIIGLKKYYNLEKGIWEELKRIRDGENFDPKISLEDCIAQTNRKLSVNGKVVELTQEQINAIKSTIDNKIVIITANAGCGKTVCINGILNLYSKGYHCTTAALSGKAARRITEATGFPSNTIHKLLEWDPQIDGFRRNAEEPLVSDVIIIDECSMVDSRLFYSLLKAIPDESKLILVFDDAQLPPIGAGAPAKDLLSSPLCINRLTKIHRQAENSGIKIDANKIRKNIDILTDEDAISIDGDKREFPEVIVHGADKDMEISLFQDSKFSKEQIFKKALKKYFELLNENDGDVNSVTIVCPMKKGINSTTNFNESIQEILLKHEPQQMVLESKTAGIKKVFKKGARVIQRYVNDYKNDIMNGEIGIILDIYKNVCTVAFDNGEKVKEIDQDSMWNMELAYAITVHSMQGSECKNVIVVLDTSHYILLDCALFYTAVTRAQEKCVLYMQPTAYRNALCNNKTDRRTFLKRIIAEDRDDTERVG